MFGWIKRHFKQKNIDRCERNLLIMKNSDLLWAAADADNLKDGIAPIILRELGRRVIIFDALPPNGRGIRLNFGTAFVTSLVDTHITSNEKLNLICEEWHVDIAKNNG